MNALLAVGLSNVAVASVLAAFAWSAGRWLRRPALTHGLWLLVFLKLLTPPVYSVPVIRTASPAPAPIVVAAAAPLEQASAPRVEVAAAQLPPVVVQEVPLPEEQGPPRQADPVPVAQAQPAAPPPQPWVPAPEQVEPRAPVVTAAQALDWSWLPRALTWAWLTGAALWLALAAVRLVRFGRLVRWGQSAPAELRALAKEVAARMDVNCPRLVLVPGTISPMLWVFGRRPRLVLPAALMDRLAPEQWRTLLAHELAHWRRRDHWVRWLELAALGLYWWCPLVWWAKRQLQQAEEECCDAWVVTTLPGAARDYALALVETVDFLCGARAVLPPAASGLGHVHLLRRRLTMILRGRTPRALTLTGLLVVLALGLLLLPMVPTWAQDPPPADLPAAQKEGKGDDKDKGPERADPDKARQEIQKLQDDYIKLQRQMEDKRRELEQKLQDEFGKKQQDLMKRMQEAMQKAGFAGNPGFGGFPGIAPVGPGAFGRAAFPNVQFAPPPGVNLPGAAFPGGLPPGAGQARPDVERRLDELERKIDRLMERLGDKGAPRRPGNEPGAPPTRSGAAPQALPPGAPPPAAVPEKKQ